MILTDVGMLAVANGRSNAYLDHLQRQNLQVNHVLVLSDPAGKVTSGQRATDLGPAFLEKLDAYGLSYTQVASTDPNSPLVLDALRSRGETVIVYSGPGGAILRKDILTLGKRFLHVHPGRLPQFRGSTTVYYQLLASPTVGVSAIFLDEHIDQGPLVCAGEFAPPSPDEDLDYGYDPRIRAETLTAALAQYARDGSFASSAQGSEGAETFYVMHPVLRHIARLKLEG